MNINTEALTNVVADSLAEVDNLLPRSTATVDEYQSLLIVYTGSA